MRPTAVSVIGMTVPNAHHNLSGPVHVKHLNSNVGHDESETWCGESSFCDSQIPEYVSCEACLEAAKAFADRVFQRLAHLRSQRLIDPAP